jgi:predicted phage tail protein
MSSYAAKVSAAIILLKDSGGSSLQAIKKQLQATKTQYRFINAAIKKGVSSGHLTKHGGKYKVKLDKAKTAKVERVQPKQVKEESSTATSKKASSSKKSSSKKTSSKKASSKTQSKTSKKSKSTKLKLTSVEKAEQKRNKAEAKAKTKAEKALVKARKKALKTSRRPMITIKVAGVSFKKAGIKKVVRKLGEVMVEDRFSAPHVVTLKREPSNPYDSNAVAVLINKTPIGYIPRSMNRSIDLTGTYLVWALRFVAFLDEYTCTIALMPPSFDNPTKVTVTGNQIYF